MSLRAEIVVQVETGLGIVNIEIRDVVAHLKDSLDGIGLGVDHEDSRGGSLFLDGVDIGAGKISRDLDDGESIEGDGEPRLDRWHTVGAGVAGRFGCPERTHREK